jgi:hypothetical protein
LVMVPCCNLIGFGLFFWATRVYFTTGIADEEHGLFGVITEDEN